MGKLIDADKLKRKCQKTATEAWKMKIKASAETIMNQFIDFIDEADAVDAVPVRRGRWIQVSQDRANCNRCNCESGKMIKQGERYFPKFCPECGADMRKDGNDD